MQIFLMLIILDYALKTKLLILNLVAEFLYLFVSTYIWNLINIYCELLVLSTKQSTISIFLLSLLHLTLQMTLQRKFHTYSYVFHIWVIFTATIFSFIYFFFLLVIDTVINMESSSLDLKSGYLSWTFRPYAPPRCQRGSTGMLFVPF